MYGTNFYCRKPDDSNPSSVAARAAVAAAAVAAAMIPSSSSSSSSSSLGMGKGPGINGRGCPVEWYNPVTNEVIEVFRSITVARDKTTVGIPAISASMDKGGRRCRIYRMGEEGGNRVVKDFWFRSPQTSSTVALAGGQSLSSSSSSSTSSSSSAAARPWPSDDASASVVTSALMSLSQSQSPHDDNNDNDVPPNVA